jgi:hypothetical protein
MQSVPVVPSQVTILSNQCPAGSLSNYQSGVIGLASATPCCASLDFPKAAYSGAAAKAAPLRGAVGYTLWGENIYGPMDAGFTNGQVCSPGLCTAGTDLDMCSSWLEYQCGTAAVNTKMFLDDCGAHASPYHYHADLSCAYSASSSQSHSALVGFALDGRGIYGQWESANTKPVLDACGGHTGPTPARTITDSSGKAVTFAAQTNAYHYHIVAGGPNTIGCYGGNTGGVTLAAAKALYSTCGDAYQTVCTSKGEISYDIDCPVFNQQGTGGTYNLQYTATCACPACKGSCTSHGAWSGSTTAAPVVSTPCNTTTPTKTSSALAMGPSSILAFITMLWSMATFHF